MKLQANKLSQGALPKPTLLAAALAHAFVGSVLASAVSQSALAAPTGGVVAAGSASITSTASTTVIRQSSNRAVLDWASFNIAPREAVTFLQPGASAAALNRIHDASASQIFGQLNANGQIFLVNPNGIVFGRTAAVNVGSLMASTADISNNDFMAGRMNFTIPGKPRAAIVNEGSISAAQGGFVALAAPNVRNGGTISARLGRVALASGDSFSLDLYGDSLISVALDRDALAGLQDAQSQPVTRYVSNDGSILADGGRIEILAASAQNLLAAAVNLGGVVRARGAESRNGVIFLDAGSAGELAIGGQLDVSGAEGTGGRIDAAGAKISLLSGSRTDASGSRGGGGIVLGDMTATDRVEVAYGAVIAADAGVQGDGGAVRLLSSRHTDFAGSISAKGGDQGGNGGTAEISSTGSVTLGSSDIRLTAHAGRAGTVLLDPTDLTIAHQPDSANVVSDFTLYNLLAAGNNVSLAATHDLIVLAAIEGRGGVAGGTVSLDAGHDLLVKNHILTNNGAITLTAGNLFSMDPNTILLAGNQPISISGAAGVSTQYIVTSGNVTLSSSAGAVNAAQTLGYSAGGQDFAIGALTINSSLVAANAVAGQTVSLNGVLASGPVTVNGYSVADGAGIKSGAAATLSAAQNIALAHDLIAPGGISLTSAGGAISTQTLDNSAGNGAITLTGAGNLTVGGGVRTTNAGYTAHTSGGTYTGHGGIDVGTGTVDIQSAGNLELQGIKAGSLELKTTGVSGSILLDAMAPGANVANAIRLNAAAGNHITLNAGHDIEVNAKIDGSAANAGDAITLTATHDLKLAESIASNNGTISLSAGNLLTMASGNVVAAGNQTITLSGDQGVTAEYLQTTGTLNLSSSGGAVTANRALVAGAVNINAGLGAANVTITPAAAQTVSLNGIQASGAVLVNGYSLSDGGGIDAGGNVTLHTVQGVTLSEYVLSGADILVRSQSAGISAKGFDTKQSLGGRVILNAAGNIGVSENILTPNQVFSATSSGGSLQVSGGIDTGSGSATLTAGNIVVGGIVTVGDLNATTTSNGSITMNAPISGSQVTLDSSKDVTLSGVDVLSGLTVHFLGDLNIQDNILAHNNSAIELGAPGNSNANSKINLHADILSEGGNISLNNDLEVFNFRDLNSATAFQALAGTPAAIHMVSDSTGGDGTVPSFKSLLFIDNTLASGGGAISLNMGHITNHPFTDEFNNKTSLNRLVINSFKDQNDNPSLNQTSGFGLFPGDVATYPAGASANYASHSFIGGTFFTSGNLPEVISRPAIAGVGGLIYFEALNQYGYFYSTPSVPTYRLVISQGTIPTSGALSNTQHAPDWLGQFIDSGQGSGNAAPSQPAPVNTAFSGFNNTLVSPGDGSIPQPGVVGAPSGVLPPTVGNGNVALALALAVPGAAAPGNPEPSTPPPASTPPVPTEATFRVSDLPQISSGPAEGEGGPAAGNAPEGTVGQSSPGDVVLGGPGALAEADLGRGTPLGGAAHEVFGKRRCLALGAPGVSAQPCVGASR